MKAIVIPLVLLCLIGCGKSNKTVSVDEHQLNQLIKLNDAMQRIALIEKAGIEVALDYPMSDDARKSLHMTLALCAYEAGKVSGDSMMSETR